MRFIVASFFMVSTLLAEFSEIHTAIMYGEYESVKMMIEEDADVVEELTGTELSPLHIAIKARHLKIAQLLLDHKADINAQDKNGISALLLAVKSKRMRLVRFLVKRQANLDIKNSSGITPLHQAAYSGNLEIVKYLIEMGATVDIENENGTTPYELAEAKDNKDVAAFLSYYK